jgi:hypothetical protein
METTSELCKTFLINADECENNPSTQAASGAILMEAGNDQI